MAKKTVIKTENKPENKIEGQNNKPEIKTKGKKCKVNIDAFGEKGKARNYYFKGHGNITLKPGEYVTEEQYNAFSKEAKKKYFTVE